MFDWVCVSHIYVCMLPTCYKDVKRVDAFFRTKRTASERTTLQG